MYKDKLVTFSDAQSGTVNQATTDYYDNGAPGVTGAPTDAYVGNWIVFKIDTAYTAGAGAPTATFQLQTSDDPLFLDSTSVTMAQSSAFVAATLAAGKMAALRIPPGMKRYFRGYKRVSASTDAEKFGAGAFSCFVVMDIDLTIDKRKMI